MGHQLATSSLLQDITQDNGPKFAGLRNLNHSLGESRGRITPATLANPKPQKRPRRSCSTHTVEVLLHQKTCRKISTHLRAHACQASAFVRKINPKPTSRTKPRVQPPMPIFVCSDPRISDSHFQKSRPKKP